MLKNSWREQIHTYDERRALALPGNQEETITFATNHFVSLANESIEKKGFFSVALSGGSTPKKIFEKLSSKEYRSLIDWSCVLLFWGDERAVDPFHNDSNYKMAMDAGLSTLGIPEENIHRMVAEKNIEENAAIYENTLKEKTAGLLDMVMLGMGEDGHTASLFPETKALHVSGKLVTHNAVVQKNCNRMTLTFEAINSSLNTCVYVLGQSKASMLSDVLKGPYQPDILPSQRVGTLTSQALWIIDDEAKSKLFSL